MKREEKIRLENEKLSKLRKDFEEIDFIRMKIVRDKEINLYYKIYNSDKERFDKDFYEFLFELDNNRKYRKIKMIQDYYLFKKVEIKKEIETIEKLRRRKKKLREK